MGLGLSGVGRCQVPTCTGPCLELPRRGGVSPEGVLGLGALVRLAVALLQAWGAGSHRTENGCVVSGASVKLVIMLFDVHDRSAVGQVIFGDLMAVLGNEGGRSQNFW